MQRTEAIEKLNQAIELQDVNEFRKGSQELKRLDYICTALTNIYYTDMVERIKMANTFSELVRITDDYHFNYKRTADNFYYYGGYFSNHLNFGYYAMHFREKLNQFMEDKRYTNPVAKLQL